MPKLNQRIIGSILLFVMLQIAWFALLGIWIYWFVATYITFTEISERVYPQIEFNPRNVASLVGGIVLLVGVAGGISVLFGSLRRQLRINRMYDSFIANMTHELKSPLASIRIHLETLLSRELPPDAARDFLRLMENDADRLEKHITSILEIARLEEPDSAPVGSPVPAVALFRSLFIRSCDRFSVTGEIEEELAGEGWLLRADEHRLEIVIDNIVDNAVKYSIQEPHLTLRLTIRGDRFRAAFTDRGIGIRAADQKSVFRKFVRLEHPDSPSVKGTGLGLYWAREIVRSHRGRMTVESAGPGTGSTFVVELPVIRKRSSA